MMKKIGVVTIGQSPRVDMTPEMLPHMGEVELVEAGALDDLSQEEIDNLYPEDGELTYISRLRSGKSAKLSKKRLQPYLQQKVLEVEKEVSATIVLCTGNFPKMDHNKPLIFPDKILTKVTEAVRGEDGKVGLIVPLPEQKDTLLDKWGETPLVVEAVSPYEENPDFSEAVKQLKNAGATVFALDCMGYTEAHKQAVKEQSELPVVLARSIVARVAAELG